VGRENTTMISVLWLRYEGGSSRIEYERDATKLQTPTINGVTLQMCVGVVKLWVHACKAWLEKT